MRDKRLQRPIQDKHLKGIRALKEGAVRNHAVVSRDLHQGKTHDDISIFPWEHYLEKLWKGEIFQLRTMTHATLE
jgi:hypothetical protein